MESRPDRAEDLCPQLQTVVHFDRYIPFDDHLVGDVRAVCLAHSLVSFVVSTTRKRAWLASIRW